MSMKKFHTFALASVLLIAGAPLAFAETDGSAAGNTETSGETVVSPRDAASGLPTGKRQHEPIMMGKEEMQAKKGEMRAKASTTRGEMKQKIEDRRGEIQVKKDEMRNNMEGKRMEIMKKHGERIVARLNAALGRLMNIADRLDSRIKKFEEKGFDTTKAKADIAIAKTKIDAAKTKIDAAKIAIAGIILDNSAATTTPGDIISGKIKLIKEQVRTAETALKEAHKALVQVVIDLKGRSGDKATSTAKTVE